MKRFVAFVACVFAVGCGGTSLSDFQTQARGAKACDPTFDTCVLAGAATCLCPTAVNAKLASSINDAAKQVACGGAQVECPTVINPRCVNDTCVADVQ